MNKKLLLLSIVSLGIIDKGSAACLVTINPNPAAVCIGGCVTLTAVATGTPPFSYLWSPGGQTTDTVTVCPIVTTTYKVTIIDAANCTSSEFVTIIVNPLPVIPSNLDTDICFGDYVQLSVFGGIHCAWSPGTYLSDSTICNPTATPTSTITYTVIVTDANGCTNTDMMMITVHPLPPIHAIAAPDSICIGSCIQLGAIGGGMTYMWLPAICPNPLTCCPTTTTTFTVITADIWGCRNWDSVTVHVFPNPCPIGIEEVNNAYDFNVYPNPFAIEFVLTGNDATIKSRSMKLYLYNVLGEEIRTVIIEKEQTVISRRGMTDGIYFYRITADEKTIRSGKVIAD